MRPTPRWGYSISPKGALTSRTLSRPPDMEEFCVTDSLAGNRRSRFARLVRRLPLQPSEAGARPPCAVGVSLHAVQVGEPRLLAIAVTQVERAEIHGRAVDLARTGLL